MNKPLLTVVHLDSPTRAVEIRSVLEAAGLEVTLQEPSADRILVQVPESEYDRAMAILHDANLVNTIPAEHFDPDADEEAEDDKPSERETLARRAFLIALIALSVWPLLALGGDFFQHPTGGRGGFRGSLIVHLALLVTLAVSAYLGVRAFFSSGKLRGWYRAYLAATAFICIGPVAFVGLVAFLAPGGDQRVAAMKRLPQPAILVGTWNQEAPGEMHELSLQAGGGMHYAITGRDPLDYDGRWGYDNHGLYLYFQVHNRGDKGLAGTRLFWPMEKFERDEIILDTGRGKITFRRK